MIRAFDRYGLTVIHGWGMTEMSPVGAVNYLKRELSAVDGDGRYAVRAKQGVPLPFVEMRAMTPEGEAPWNGEAMGELEVRGPWIAAGYHDLPEETDKWSDDGWFRTGDVVTIDEHATSRSPTVSRISSSGRRVDQLRGFGKCVVGHAKVAEAAVIAIPDEKWGERPLAVVVLKAGQSATEGELRDYLAPKFAKIWLPDGFVFAPEIPRTSTGKMLKAKLREQFKDWKKSGDG